MSVQQRTDRRVDQAGFEAFYRREALPLAALATALTGSRETGADLAHEALLRAYRGWPSISTYERPGAWARRVLLNLAADDRRRRGRERSALARVPATSDVQPSDPADEAFWSAVRDLPPRQRDTVVLRYVDDLPVDEIAEILEVTPGTVKAALFAARSTLAQRFATEEAGHAHD